MTEEKSNGWRRWNVEIGTLKLRYRCGIGIVQVDLEGGRKDDGGVNGTRYESPALYTYSVLGRKKMDRHVSSMSLVQRTGPVGTVSYDCRY